VRICCLRSFPTPSENLLRTRHTIVLASAGALSLAAAAPAVATPGTSVKGPTSSVDPSYTLVAAGRATRLTIG